MKEKNIVIGIEGLVGSGKTSICRTLLDKIPNSVLLEGGNLYRAMVYAIMKANTNLTNLDELSKYFSNADVKEIMEKLKIEIRLENRETVIFQNGEKIEEEKLQCKETSMAVSVAANSNINNKKMFESLKQIINSLKQKYNVVISGRALMQIYPQLDYHFLITASIEERVKRKGIQYKGKMTKEELKNHIIKRDELQEESGFYKIYEKTQIIDVTECKSVEESTKKVSKYIKEIRQVVMP